MITLDRPLNLLFLLLPIVVYFATRPYKKLDSSIKASFFYYFKNLKTGFSRERSRSTRKTTVLLSIAWALFCVALAKPVKNGAKIEREFTSKSFYLALDLSGSMVHKDAKDGQTRLDNAKKVLVDFIKKRKGDNIGLILFGDAAYLQAPLTKDIDVLVDLVEESQVGMAGLSTTIGDAIGLGIKSLRDAQAKDKVLIVLTDGNDTGSSITPIKAAKIAESFGLKVYTIGFGDPETVGENPMDETTLKEIANITSAKYYRPKSSDQLLDVFVDIDSLEESKITKTTYVPKLDLFFYPLAIVLSIFFYLIFSSFYLGRGINA